MTESVLVPMDDSTHAVHALEYAFETFPTADITVLHVVGVPSMMMGEATALALEDELETAAENYAEDVFTQAHSVAEQRDREISTVVGIGHPARNILKRAKNYDAIVLGAHGADRGRATRRFLIGNIAETVVKRASTPVIVVR